MIEIIVIGGCMAMLVIQEYQHYQERKDLYNRLMARNINEYQATMRPSRPPPKSRNFVAAGMRKYFERQEAGE